MVMGRLTRTAFPICAGLGALAVSALIAACSAASDSGARGCDRFASPAGSDRASGTANHPVSTPGELIRRLQPGQVGCLRPGRYRFGTLSVDKPYITLRATGRGPTILRGSIQVRPAGLGSKLSGMRINTSGGRSPVGIRIFASNFVLEHNRITNYHRAQSCVLVGRYYSHPSPGGVGIRGNRIHDCGRIPRTNHDHGIYVAHAVGAEITDNWIYGNADRGIQLYPDAQRTSITGNVVYGNGEGINFAGAGTTTSNGNTVSGNIIADSRVRWNAASGPDGPPATGNLFARNCVHAGARRPDYNVNGGVEDPSRNFVARENRIASPGFVDAAHGDLRLRRGSPCRELYTGKLSLR